MSKAPPITNYPLNIKKENMNEEYNPVTIWIDGEQHTLHNTYIGAGSILLNSLKRKAFVDSVKDFDVFLEAAPNDILMNNIYNRIAKNGDRFYTLPKKINGS